VERDIILGSLLGVATYFDKKQYGFAASFFLQTRRNMLRSFGKQNSRENSWVLILFGGERDCLRFAHTSSEFDQKIKCCASPWSFFLAVDLESKLSTLYQ
jgi:hypothetical protein